MRLRLTIEYDGTPFRGWAAQPGHATVEAELRDALAATKDFPGASGTITMDADRNAQKPIVILKVQDGKWKYVTSIKP